MSKFLFKDVEPLEIKGEVCFVTDICGQVNTVVKKGKPYTMPRQQVRLPFGDDRTFRVLLRDKNKDIVNTEDSSSVLELYIRERDMTPVLSLSTDVPEEGMVGTADNGEIFFFFTSTTYDSLEKRMYYYKIVSTLSSGKSYTVVNGNINIT